MFYHKDYVKKITNSLQDENKFRIGCVLYGANSEIHDKITRSKNSFKQTLEGIKNLLQENIKVELRIPVNKINYENLPEIPYLIKNEIPIILSSDFIIYYYQNVLKNTYKDIQKNAFYENVWDEDAFNKIVAVSSKFSDVRVGIKLLKSAGELAERDGSKKIEKEHAEEAISKTENFKIKSSDDFTDEEKLILEVCKNCSGQRIGKLYDYYLSVGGKKSEKTLKRKLQALEKKGVIEIELSGEGFKGKSSIIKFKGLEATKLSDFEAKI